jgi:hypothetical protein
MKFEHLRHQRFDEPASLEGRSTRRVPTTKQVQHCEESCIVENRTDRTDKQDKLGNLTNLPTAWFPRHPSSYAKATVTHRYEYGRRE